MPIEIPDTNIVIHLPRDDERLGRPSVSPIPAWVHEFGGEDFNVCPVCFKVVHEDRAGRFCPECYCNIQECGGWK